MSVGLVYGCQDRKAPGKRRTTTARVAAVKPEAKAGAVNDRSGFCEKTFPATGPSARAFKWPPLRPLPGQAKTTPPELQGRWTWVNLWATWCVPCMDEMPLLGRWARSLSSEGIDIGLELLTIDNPDAGAAVQAKIKAGLPGPVRWLAGKDDFPGLLDSLGLDPHAAIPIHALVDPTGQLRCVRVGAIHSLDFAAIKGIISGG